MDNDIQPDTERRRHAQGAIHGADRFRQVVECAPNAMVMVNRLGRIEMVNLETERLFGYHREDLLGQSVEMLIPARHRDSHTRQRGAFLDEPQSRPMGKGRDLHGLRKDGTEFPVEIGLNRIETDFGPMVLSAIVDISGRRTLEERLRATTEALHQAQKMESLGEMTGGIAHDFNNALTVIAGSIDTVAQSGELKSRRAVRALDYAARGVARAAKLTTHLLAFARRQSLDPKTLVLRELVENMSEMLARILGPTIAIQFKHDRDLWTVSVDEGLLEDALLNLALNARDAMPDGGTLMLDTANMHLSAEDLRHEDAPPGDYGMIAIRDTGWGMTKDVCDRAFEPFFTTKGIGKGTGLGLSQVYGFVHQSGGWVQVESSPGKGTVFRLYFPRER